MYFARCFIIIFVKVSMVFLEIYLLRTSFQLLLWKCTSHSGIQYSSMTLMHLPCKITIESLQLKLLIKHRLRTIMRSSLIQQQHPLLFRIATCHFRRSRGFPYWAHNMRQGRTSNILLAQAPLEILLKPSTLFHLQIMLIPPLVKSYYETSSQSENRTINWGGCPTLSQHMR